MVVFDASMLLFILDDNVKASGRTRGSASSI